MRDKSNKCQKCGHTYTSVHHQRRCMGRSGGQIRGRHSAGRGGRHSASSVLTFSSYQPGITASASFFEDRKKEEAVQS